MIEAPSLEILQESISNPQNPVGMRMRAAYYLRQAHLDGDDAQKRLVVKALSEGLENVDHGSLMRHEFAYIMGQLRDNDCCEILEKILAETEDNVMVRHEAAEALGAIGAKRSKDALATVQSSDPVIPELAETCQLALNVMEWRDGGGDPEKMPAVCACMVNPYSSVDPAPPHPSHADKTFEELGDILSCETLPLFERYRAMFSLRNMGGAESVSQLCRALTTDSSSALLRHEVAYVLGQMQHPSAVEALEASLQRQDEHEMVRHEAAEALGAIDGRWEDVEKILNRFLDDRDVVVRESCLVALDAADYWGHGNTVEAELLQGTFSVQKNQDQRILANHFNIAD